MHVIRGAARMIIEVTDTFRTKNTRFAAALITLGYELVRKEALGAITAFDFSKDAEKYDHAWRNMVLWSPRNLADPLTYMHKVSSARDWIVGRVLHPSAFTVNDPYDFGTYNPNVELSGEVFETKNINMACCLVAAGFFLIKLDKETRSFYFPAKAVSESDRYRNPPEGTCYYWQTKYLHNFYLLHKAVCSDAGDLTRQPQKPTITSNNAR